MDGTGLRHIAIVAGGPSWTAADSASAVDAVAGAVRTAAALAEEAFASIPGLCAFSFIAPGIDRLLADPATAAALSGCVEGAAILGEAAARCGAALRLCGRNEGLPVELSRLASPLPAPADPRTLLWFLRYGGRDEIVRAAGRFFREHPGATLGDDDLDGYLDTGGVPDPDLIVLAGGPLAAPDALVWQGSYAELWHTATPWAAFGVDELRLAVADFNARQRRFGG